MMQTWARKLAVVQTSQMYLLEPMDFGQSLEKAS